MSASLLHPDRHGRLFFSSAECISVSGNGVKIKSHLLQIKLYLISDISLVGRDAYKVTLTPHPLPLLSYLTCQFVLLSFRTRELSAEEHPFTSWKKMQPLIVLLQQVDINQYPLLSTTTNSYRQSKATRMFKPLTVTLLFFLVPAQICIAENEAANISEYELKAVCLYNFTHFAYWPAEKKPQKSEPVTIGVVGHSPFGEAFVELQAIAQQGHKMGISICYYGSSREGMDLHQSALYQCLGKEQCRRNHCRPQRCTGAHRIGHGRFSESRRYDQPDGPQQQGALGDKPRRPPRGGAAAECQITAISSAG